MTNTCLTPENIQTLLNEIYALPGWDDVVHFVDTGEGCPYPEPHDHPDMPVGFALKAQAAEYISELLDLTLIGNGSFRATFEYKGLALKIALSESGFEDNLNEHALWSESETYPALSEGLVPCLGGDKRLMFYGLAKPVYQTDVTPATRFLRSAFEQGVVFSDCNPEDETRQWGLYDGRMVLLDYAWHELRDTTDEDYPEEYGETPLF